jgi:hypothetical protein
MAEVESSSCLTNGPSLSMGVSITDGEIALMRRREAVGGYSSGVYCVPESVVVLMGAGKAGERAGWVGVWWKEESAGDVEAWL